MKVTLLEDSNGDWMGLYIGDELQRQGHSINAWDVLYALRERGLIDFEYKEAETEDRYPESLSELNIEE